MEARRRTWFDDRGLTISAPGSSAAGARRLPFYAGAMHYWRVEPARWSACLRQMHAQGLTIVETYVPWRVHEPKPGHYDWSGPRDLAKFVAAASSAGLAVALRPGPHVNAELTSFGFPDHVLAVPEHQARSSRGTPVWMPSPPRAWPVPSYASVAFRKRVRTWYAAVAEVVQPLLAPDGPVVALGVDNECQMFFRLGAYDHDYHPDAIAWWREASGLDGEPPRAWDPVDPARCISWVRFKDQYIARALGDFAAALDDAGLAGVAKFHNLPPGHHGLYDVRLIQTSISGPVGIDAYTPRTEFRELRRRATALVGNAQPLPIAFEVGVGFFPWFPPLDRGDDPDRERDQLLSLLAAGIRGFNLFMAVERDRYYGAAIEANGTLAAKWIQPLLRALAEVDWPALRRVSPIALIETRADLRFGIASNTIDPMTPVVAEILGLGPGGAAELGSDPAAIAARRWQTAIISALDLAQVPYAIVDESASEAELARYRAVIVPTLDRVDRGIWQRISALAEHKRAVVVIGPGTPTHDELGQPLGEPAPRRAGKLKDGSLEDLPGLAADLADLAGEPSNAWHVERPGGVRAYAYADANDKIRAVFVASDVAKPVSARLVTDEATKGLRDPFGARIAVTQGAATIELPAHGIRMFVVE